MEGECFLNSCFGPKLALQPTPYSGKIARMASANRYEDPKLNAQCLVILDRLQLTPSGKFEIPGPRKPRVFRVYSDCEVENTNDIRTRKNHRKRRVKGTKRLLQLSDSEDDFDCSNERLDYNLNNFSENLHTMNSAITSSEFVVEKSVSTPEGNRVLKSTISSTSSHTAQINSLTQFKLCQVEEITLSSDEEEMEFSNKPDLGIAIAMQCTAETKEKSHMVDKSLPQASDGVEGVVSELPALATLATCQGTTVAEKENQSTRTTGNEEEKLKALLASDRFKPKGKLTKPTIPQAISRRQRASSAKSSKKINKEHSMRKKLQEEQDLGSYCASVKTAHDKNSSSTTPVTGEVTVRAIGNKRQNYLLIQKPPVSLPPNVKAKTTSVSRGDKLTADLIVGENLRKIQKKDSLKSSFRSRAIPARQSRSKNVFKSQPTSSFEGELSKRENELVATDANATHSLSFKPRLKRVARIPSNESTDGSGSLRHIPTFSRNRNKDQEKQFTASNRANLALKEGISRLKHSVSNLYGQSVKRSMLLLNPED
ncbi:uncharacterized protein LOC130689959 isoform X2 [Daphnia carinata]|uniref:uncharacterized protein LOC130689959 isoform X2 n=1 Tax=Daphnia carinata TaxID=120202 RepID=UPI00257B8884|nr:uncharacterized protein LOC130689959 isoform X2 [Daphnia carinata]